MSIAARVLVPLVVGALGLAGCAGGEPLAEVNEADQTAAATPGATEDGGDPRTEASPARPRPGPGPTRPPRGEPVVAVKSFRFLPDSLTVTAGTRVQWQNEDTGPHTVTTGTPETPTDLLDKRLPGTGGTVELTFDAPGSYPYFCDIHPSMRGEVIVE